MQTQAPSAQTRRNFVTWLSALSLTGLARPLAADRAVEDEAEAAARAWLEVVDEGRYVQSWGEAAPAFKEAITQDQWLQALASARSPLGDCVSRRRTARRLVDAVPGVPKGPYVVIQFTSEFRKRASAVETITPALGTDGRWHVSGYFIR